MCDSGLRGSHSRSLGGAAFASPVMQKVMEQTGETTYFMPARKQTNESEALGPNNAL